MLRSASLCNTDTVDHSVLINMEESLGLLWMGFYFET